MKTYLSGGMEYALNFGSDWRKEIEIWVEENLNHNVFNPCNESIRFFNEKYPGFNRALLKDGTQERIREIIGNLVKFECGEIIKNIDYVICFWDESCKKGAGTQGEVTIAKYYDKPVYLITQIPISELSSWIIGCTEKIFFDFDTLKIFLKNKYPK